MSIHTSYQSFMAPKRNSNEDVDEMVKFDSPRSAYKDYVSSEGNLLDDPYPTEPRSAKKSAQCLKG